MKLETLFEKFDQFAAAPNAVAKMRELILQLAVQGRLVEQLEDEGSGCELLETARAERHKLVADRKIKARLSAPVSPDEQPYEIPETWRWARLAEIGYELGQKVPNQRFTYIDVGSIDSDRGRVSARVEILEPNEAPSRARKLVARGTVIYSTVRPYLRNIAIIDREFEYEPIASTAFGILHPFAGIDSRFLFYWLRSAPFTAYVLDGMKGMAYPAINDEKFYSGYIPVPPSAEQRWIVAKVDELMALCDRLETQQQERDTRHAVLARASLARFADTPTPANLNLFFHPSYTITPADLRKTILTLAVQGKLVPQDPKDEPATQQLAAIQARKDELVCKNQIKKGTPSRSIDPSEVDHDIPVSWVWVRLVDVCELITDGTHQTPKYTAPGRIFLSAQNVKPFRFMPAKHRFVSEEDYQGYIKNRKTEKGDVLLTRVGAGIGEAATVDQDLDFAIYVSLGLVRPVRGFVFSDYITLWLNSPDGTEKSSRNTYGKGVSQGNLNLSLIRNFLVPLPPLAEQRRIVAKVDQLMALVDQLKTQLTASRASAVNLMEAVVAELTAQE